MNQTDEAFIQAYSSPQTPGSPEAPISTPRVPVRPPHAGLHGGPHMPLVNEPQPQPQVETPQVAWAPEPIPTPHFQAPVQQPASPVGALVQAVGTAAPQEPAAPRLPLSSYATVPQPTATMFQPMFEVDRFRWPQLIDDLLTEHHRLLIPVAEQLLDVSEQGRSLIGIAGTRANVGCSTIMLCLARLMANADKSIALVDANFAKASLGRDLGLQFDTGWENVLTGEMPLAECVVKSNQDRMALLPLAKRSAAAHELLASIQTSVTAGVLRYHYDVVLFNMGAAAEPPQDHPAHSVMQHCRLDAGIIVADTERIGIDPVDTLLSLFGNTCLGMIGNTAVT